VLAVLALVSVPLTTGAGEWLEHRIPRTPLVRAHAELGDYMLPWAVGLAVVAVLVVVHQRWWSRRAAATTEPANVEIRGSGERRPTSRDERTAGIVLAVLAVVVAVGSVTTVYRIGDSGARAAWTGQFSPQPLPRTGPRPANPN
jgi:hypothetical protein